MTTFHALCRNVAERRFKQQQGAPLSAFDQTQKKKNGEPKKKDQANRAAKRRAIASCICMSAARVFMTPPLSDSFLAHIPLVPRHLPKRPDDIRNAAQINCAKPQHAQYAPLGPERAIYLKRSLCARKAFVSVAKAKQGQRAPFQTPLQTQRSHVKATDAYFHSIPRFKSGPLCGPTVQHFRALCSGAQEQQSRPVRAHPISMRFCTCVVTANTAFAPLYTPAVF